MTNAEALLDEIIASDQQYGYNWQQPDSGRWVDGPTAEKARQVKAHVLEQEGLKKEVVKELRRMAECAESNQERDELTALIERMEQ